jgi:protein transport protein SEC61 subunit gamma-like protein
MKKITKKIKPFFMKCKRVWHALKKPSKEEFKLITKVSGLGILILGVLGFLISIIMKTFLGNQ